MNYKTVTGNGYIYDKRIFWAIIGIILIFLTGLAIHEKFNFRYYFYFKCDSDFCKNSMLDVMVKNSITNYDYKRFCSEDWCNQEYLSRGEYGRKAPFLLNHFGWFVVLMTGLALVANHLIWNKGKKFDVTLNVPEKWKKKFNETMEKGDE